MAQYTIPYNSNLRYLPMVYFLPQDLIAKCPTLRTLPRNIREILQSETLKATVESDSFLNEIMDATAALAFPHFGFGGWKEHYTGDCPVWKLSYSLPLWENLLESETDINLQSLYELPIIPFYQPEYIKMIMERVVHRGIYEQNWQPILDVIKQMPCEEDFEKWNTRVYKDFLRKWYHTRTKIKMVSLEACMEIPEHKIHKIAIDTADIAGNAESEDFVERFKARLSQKDKEILVLRVQGYTYEKIAELLDYKNHSGVIKRMKAITKAFEIYEDEQ